jgi:biotin carboxylase
MPGLLSIGAGPFQVPLIKKAKKRGLTVIACDGDPAAPGLKLATRSHIADIRDPEACLAIARSYGVDAVTCLATEAGVVSAAHVAETLGLPGLPLAAARRATDKLAMRRAFEAAGLASTAYFDCESQEQAQHAFGSIGGPVVVKPANGAGSRGVSYVENRLDLTNAYRQAREVAGMSPVLVEAYMPGREVAVEGFMWGDEFDLLCISDKTRTDPPHLLDLRIEYPSLRPRHERQAIADLAEAAARALGVRNAPLHIEIMMTADGPHLVEVAARGAGFHVFSEIAPWVTGVDTVSAQIDLAYGLRPAAEGRLERAAILDFPRVPPGRITAISGVDEIHAHPGIMFFELFRKVGDVVGPLRSGADRVCAIAVKAGGLDDARDVLAWAHGVLRIETHPN